MSHGSSVGLRPDVRTGTSTRSPSGQAWSRACASFRTPQIDAERDRLAGVTYHDPDGSAAYCYNTETASIRLHLYERAPRVGGWAHAATFEARGRAHFEYAQRTPVPDHELHLT